jgi:hypothetical protein
LVMLRDIGVAFSGWIRRLTIPRAIGGQRRAPSEAKLAQNGRDVPTRTLARLRVSRG